MKLEKHFEVCQTVADFLEEHSTNLGCEQAMGLAYELTEKLLPIFGEEVEVDDEGMDFLVGGLVKYFIADLLDEGGEE